MEIVFDKNNNKSYDVQLYTDPNQPYWWLTYGRLEFDEDQKTWVLWTGTSFTSKELGKIIDMSDEGESYTDDLKESQEQIKDDLNNWYNENCDIIDKIE